MPLDVFSNEEVEQLSLYEKILEFKKGGLDEMNIGSRLIRINLF